jgi:hypothetical protein
MEGMASEGTEARSTALEAPHSSNHMFPHHWGFSGRDLDLFTVNSAEMKQQ